MPLWKQRLFSRLMAPADEGADLGGSDATSATEAAIDIIGTADVPESSGVDAGAESTTDAPEGEPAKAGNPGSKTAALLESMSETPTVAKPAEKETPKPADATAADKPPVAPTAEQEEAELLDGVKSDRGRERIKNVFAEKKQLETDIGEFRQLINDTGMKPQEFAQTLEFGRLVNSGNEADTRVALEMLELQRTALYEKLGVEAPGVDLLQGHADLKQQVDDMEISRERAVELAKHRTGEGARKASEAAQREAQQGRQEYAQTVNSAAGQMESYLDTRKNEVDHPARMKVISEHFRNPENMKQFVATYRPEQWAPTMKMMYDNISLSRPQAPTSQPLRSRSAHLGAPAASGSTAIDRIASRMDAMGL